jgi:hypothetical protein
MPGERAGDAFGPRQHFVAQQKGRWRDACGLPGEKLFEIPNSHPLPPDARAASRGREALWSQKRGFAERNSVRVAGATHVSVPRDPDRRVMYNFRLKRWNERAVPA